VLVPKLQLGNLDLASSSLNQPWKQELPRPHSQAGAWERLETLKSDLISKMFQLNPKRRRNLGSMDGAGFWGIPAIWIPAIHAGMTE